MLKRFLKQFFCTHTNKKRLSLEVLYTKDSKGLYEGSVEFIWFKCNNCEKEIYTICNRVHFEKRLTEKELSIKLQKERVEFSKN